MQCKKINKIIILTFILFFNILLLNNIAYAEKENINIEQKFDNEIFIIDDEKVFKDKNFINCIVDYYSLESRSENNINIFYKDMDIIKNTFIKNLDFSNKDISIIDGINYLSADTVNFNNNKIKKILYNPYLYNIDTNIKRISFNNNKFDIYDLEIINKDGIDSLSLDNNSIYLDNDRINIKFSENPKVTLSLNNCNSTKKANYNFNEIGYFFNNEKIFTGQNITDLYYRKNNIKDNNKIVFPIKLKNLYFEDNSLSNFLNLDNINISNLKNLYLDDNRIKDLDMANLQKNINTPINVSIDGNKLLYYKPNKNINIIKNEEYLEESNFRNGKCQFIFNLKDKLSTKEEKRLKEISIDYLEKNCNNVLNFEALNTKLKEDEEINNINFKNILNEEALQLKFNLDRNRYEIFYDDIIRFYNEREYNLNKNDILNYEINKKFNGQIEFKIDKENKVLYCAEESKNKFPLLTLFYKDGESELELFIPVNLKDNYRLINEKEPELFQKYNCTYSNYLEFEDIFGFKLYKNNKEIKLFSIE